MDNLDGFRDAIKYVGGAGCLMMIGGAFIVIMMVESHLRLAKLEKSDGEMSTEKLLARLLELGLVLAAIFAGYYLFAHYL
jgi:hypothetical protein